MAETRAAVVADAEAAAAAAEEAAATEKREALARMASAGKNAAAVAAAASEAAASVATEAATAAAAEAATRTVEKAEKAEQRSRACRVLGEVARRGCHRRKSLTFGRWGRVAMKANFQREKEEESQRMLAFLKQKAPWFTCHQELVVACLLYTSPSPRD